MTALLNSAEITDFEGPATLPINESILHAPGRTDWSNAKRFARMYRGRALYCHPWKKWIIWDGCRWKIDDTGAAMRLGKEVAKSIFDDAIACGDSGALAFAAKSASAKGIENLLKLAESENGIPVLPEHFDKNPMLFNCPNGTIQLATGVLQRHRREDFITKLCPTEFDPNSSAEVFEQFVSSIFGGSASLIGFMRRLSGYCLTGDVREQILTILHGAGANGKSTFLNAMLDTLGGDYGIKARKDVLVVRAVSGHSTEQMDLCGKRLVVVSETDEGSKLDEAGVKDLTGGDKIRGRRMREDNWEYSPTHKLLMATNHRPQIRGTDHAIWRRLRLVPFTQVFDGANQDRELPAKLRGEATGILAWAVRGCLEWRADGLGMPDEVSAATAEYRGEQDLLGAFIEECCLTMQGMKVRANEIFEVYKKWAQARGEDSLTQTGFGNAMKERGIEKMKSGYVWYTNIGLRGEECPNYPK